MAGWISLGVVGLAVVVLVASVGSVFGRLQPLRRAQRRLALRTEQAQTLQKGADRLQEQADELAEALAVTQERSEALRDSAEDVRASVAVIRQARAAWPGAVRRRRT